MIKHLTKHWKKYIAGAVVVLGLGFGSKQFVSSTITPSPIATESASITPATGSCHARQIDPSNIQFTEPDPSCNPSLTDPTKTAAIICASGYTTKSVRPPASYTTALKIKQIQQYGYSDTNTKDYEEDHIISLELGGSPTDPKNLWPEPGFPNPKDQLENTLHKMVCSGQIDLGEAQKEISTDWVTAYHKYVSH